MASCGRDYPCSENSLAICEEAGKQGYDFIATYIAHPWCCFTSDNLPDELPPINCPDLFETCSGWTRLFVAKISPWIDVDSSDVHLRTLSEKALNAELSYYTYLNCAAIMIEITSERHRNLAKIVNKYLCQKNALVVWISVPLNLPKNDGGDVKRPASESSDPWHWVYSFRTACDNKPGLGVALRLTSNIPESAETPEMLRWSGEPIKTIVVDTTLFTSCKIGTPVLDGVYETMIKHFFQLNIQILMTGEHSDLHDQPSKNATKPAQPLHCAYFTYCNFLHQSVPEPDIVSQWAVGYEDCLQKIKQPIVENLAMPLYDNLEQDSSKYETYVAAIRDALNNIFVVEQRSALVIMVLGAGRGPLVTAVMDAVSNNSCAVKLKVYAVEKNPNAAVTLNHLVERKWTGKNVTIVNEYFSKFQPPDGDKADIVVSELLGAFGDNELSPECLDGAVHLMKESCLSIPNSYTSYICPFMSPKLYNAVREMAENPKELTTVFETTYVVRPLNHFMVDECQPLFTFNHPNFAQTSNDRYSEVTFTASASCDMHGLFGFFRAWLYDHHRLTILPKQHTPGLFSWFPVIFPFREPIYVRKGQNIVVHFWRCSDSRHVWYEWCLSKPVQTPIMNCKGRSCVIRKL